MKKSTAILFVLLLGLSALVIGCTQTNTPDPPIVEEGNNEDDNPLGPESVPAIEWFYLADIECLCESGEQVDGEKFIEQLVNLPDTEFSNALSSGAEFINKVRPYANTLLELKRERLVEQDAYKLWDDVWPAEFPLEIRSRDPEVEELEDEAFIITSDTFYLLWPFDVGNPILKNQLIQKAESVNFNPPVLPYDATQQVLASSLFGNLDRAIENDETFRENVKKCMDRGDSDQRHSCIRDFIDEIDGATTSYPSFLRFSARVDAPLVETMLQKGPGGIINLLISPNESGEYQLDFIPEHPCGRFDP